MLQFGRSSTFVLVLLATLVAVGTPARAQHDGDVTYEYSPNFKGYPHEPGCACDDPHCGSAAMYDEGWVDRDWWHGFCEHGRFRHSSTHGRWSGHGGPLRSTSWLNRPFEFGLDFGAFVMTKPVSPNNTKNGDVLAAAHLGWDWDHYWGTQFRLAWTSPEFSSSVPATNAASNNVLLYDVTMLYYPWGDSRTRPYWRFGVGLTDIDFINQAGVREDNTLFTLPVGIGIKHQLRRWLVMRAEVVDHISFAQNSASGMNNFTLTCGLECRFGGRPTNSWSSPNRHHGGW